MQQNHNNLESQAVPPFVFFGGPQISIDFLDNLESAGLIPDLIVTTPDRPAGRKMQMTSPPLRAWADERSIPVLQPEKFRPIEDELSGYDLFVVVAYGKIIPKFILDIPKHGSLNVHPSLLPKYRGPSPIISAMLADDKQTGVSLMVLDELMDHGPIVAKTEYEVQEWLDSRNIEKLFAGIGADMFIETISGYIDGSIQPQEQEHGLATECQKFTKADMQLDLDKPRDAYLRYLSFNKPFFFHNGERVIITDAEFTQDREFTIKKVIPAGKKEQSWNQYLLSRQ